MKHSAKATARLARQRDKLDRRGAGRAGASAGVASRASTGRPSQGSTGVANAGGASANGAPTAAAAGAGAAEHQRLAQLPYALVLAGTTFGLVLMQVNKDAVRSGTLVIAGALLAGSLTRLVLPEGRAGLLGSRRRLVDVALLTALGAGLLIAGLIVSVPG